jgi:hypothetical protein
MLAKRLKAFQTQQPRTAQKRPAADQRSICRLHFGQFNGLAKVQVRRNRLAAVS